MSRFPWPITPKKTKGTYFVKYWCCNCGHHWKKTIECGTYAPSETKCPNCKCDAGRQSGWQCK